MTVITLRPSGSTTTTGISVTGAGSAHAALSDDSDSSYVEFTATDNWVGDLDNLTLPAGAVIKNAAVRVRAAYVSGATPVLRARLSPPTIAPPFYAAADVTVNWTSPTTVVFGASTVTATDTDIDAAVGQISAQPLIGTVRAYEYFADITVVEQPTVVADGPSGSVTDTNVSTVTWTPSFDADGGPQTFYEVRVFTDAQYGAGGFDPYNSTATVETEDTGFSTGASGSDVSWQITEPLGPDTYRAYVRVAQTVNGVTHWSTFDFVEFTVSTDVPGTPSSLLAVADSSNARVTLIPIDNPGVASTDAFELQRSVDSGSTWETVRTLDPDGIVQQPFLAATSTAASASDVLPTPAYPEPNGGVLPGDLFIAFCGLDANPTVTWPAGWVPIKDEAGNGNAVRASVAYKWADGGEFGAIDLQASGVEAGGVRVLCIRHADPDTPPEVSTGVSGSGANADPDAVSPSWTGLSFVVAAMVNDGNVAVTAGPSGYFNFGNTRWANAAGAGVATATNISDSASVNPGAFTHTAEDTRAFTVAVRARIYSVVVHDYESPNGTSAQYRARALHDYGGTWAASAWTNAAAPVAWTSGSWWLKHPSRPDLNVAVTVRSLPGFSSAGRAGVFQALGATTAVVVQDTRAARTGQVVLRAMDETHQADLDALVDTNEVLLLQSPAGQGGPDYVAVLGHTRTRIVDWYDASRTWEAFDVVVVPSPPGEVVNWP